SAPRPSVDQVVSAVAGAVCCRQGGGFPWFLYFHNVVLPTSVAGFDHSRLSSLHVPVYHIYHRHSPLGGSLASSLSARTALAIGAAVCHLSVCYGGPNRVSGHIVKYTFFT